MVGSLEPEFKNLILEHFCNPVNNSNTFSWLESSNLAVWVTKKYSHVTDIMSSLNNVKSAEECPLWSTSLFQLKKIVISKLSN